MQQRGIVLNSLHSVIYLLEIYLFNSESTVLLPNFAICVHATGTCVCNTALSVPVSHTIHTNGKSKTVDSMAYTHTHFFLYIFIHKNDTYAYIFLVLLCRLMATLRI
jgi:hypothetical protein